MKPMMKGKKCPTCGKPMEAGEMPDSEGAGDMDKMAGGSTMDRMARKKK